MNNTIKKPTSILCKPVKIGPKFLLEILSGAMKLSKGELESGIKEITNSFFKIDVIDNPQEKAWLLISSSAIKTIYRLTYEAIINNLDIPDLSFLEKEIIKIFDKINLEIDKDFFYKPSENKLIKNIIEFFGKFLITLNFEDADIKNLKSRFPRYYIAELVNEWSNNRNKYKIILNLLEKTPFDDAMSKEEKWFLYYESLRIDIEKPMFGETFSIKDIHVNLRGYYQQNSIDNKVIKKIVIDVNEELNRWINSEEKKDCLKIISGGPGYGKTTTLKILASELTFQKNYKVIYIPLQYYHLKDEIEIGVNKFLKDGDFLKEINIFEEKKLLIIFDGLDELPITDKSLEIATKEFIKHIKNEINSKNRNNIKIKIILSGREIIIQNNESEFKNRKEILHLLPFYISSYHQNYCEYEDDKKLLTIDQRNIWWKKYGELKGKNYEGLPLQINKKELIDITSYPLLNYLLALSFENGTINSDNTININSIYENLITGVYERTWSEGIHSTVKHMEYSKFIDAFEKIALNIWHVSGRRTTITEIKKAMEQIKISNNLFVEMEKDSFHF